MSWRHAVHLLIALAILAAPTAILAQDACTNNHAANASIEEGSRSTGGLGTRPSSIAGNAWSPWSVWGDRPYSQEAEFDIEDITRIGHYSTYRVHSGSFSQKFSTRYGVHTAGIFQRVAVPKGSTVTFSMWVQIYTGQQSVISENQQISDLNQPGNYRAWVGIDPQGGEPGFGAPPPDRTVWSDAVIDRETRRYYSNGLPYDAWVQLKVTAKAEADHITIFTRGQPEFAVAQNVSYWDDACLTYVAPKPAATNTSKATNTPKATSTPVPTEPPTATATLPPTVAPTQPPLPKDTPLPPATETPVPPPTATPAPTGTPLPTLTSAPPPAPTRTPLPPAVAAPTDSPILLVLFAAVWLSAAAYLVWSIWQRLRRPRPA